MRRNSKTRRAILLTAILCLISAALLAQGPIKKPKLTLDEFFNSVSFANVKISPDGNSVVFETERADWDQQLFRTDLWLYKIAGARGELTQLTQSGHDTAPQWSPDGRWIAFLSERKSADARDPDDESEVAPIKEKDKDVAQLYLLSPNGGEAFALTSGDEDVHAFAWSKDSKRIFFATREPWTKQQNDEHRKEWKDVIRYRGDERGDVIFSLDLDGALARHATLGTKEIPEEEKESGATFGTVAVARTPLRVSQIAVSGDSRRLAFLSSSVSERQEKIEDIEIFTVDLISTNAKQSMPKELTPFQVTRNEAVELELDWAPDNRHIFFQVNLGSVEKKYEDPQPRLYWIDASDPSVKAQAQRWFSEYGGEVVHYTALPDGSVVCACRLATEIQFVSQADPSAPLVKRNGWPGTYESPTAATRASRMAFVYSSILKPAEVYVADGVDKLTQARAITSFNQFFTERELPNARPYRWTSDDGTTIEGMLMYPPGKFGAKNLPVFVFIHGGPQDADGDHFEADWYQWDRLAATAGWLVFEPNYRGSTGYGDTFALQVVPEIVSRPGKDILAGVDALVKDGIADSQQLAIGGYSYGGYLTNWLITQTTRFKAAVTGAGGVENVADWGNDDSSVDDADVLGGLPWEVPGRYQSEAAINQINRVKTPTHMVAGGEDVRVPTLESYLLDRALHELGVPSELLIFPGEGHSLGKNPWHGKIKVREELKWLTKYGGVGP